MSSVQSGCCTTSIWKTESQSQNPPANRPRPARLRCSPLRSGGCPAAPRVRSRSCEDRHYLRCAIRRKLPRRDLRGEHPGPESRVGKSRGYVSGRGTRTRSSLIGLKGGEAVRQTASSICGPGIFGGQAAKVHFSFHPMHCSGADTERLRF